MTDLPAAVEASLIVAERVAGESPGTVVARPVVPGVLVESPLLPHRGPRNLIEILVDGSGVVVVGTGWDSTRPVYWAAYPLPREVCDVTLLALRAVLTFHVRFAAIALAQQVAPRARGLFGP